MPHFERHNHSITEIIYDVEDSVNKLVRSLVYKTHLPIASFEPWKTAIMKLGKRQIRAHRHEANFTNSILDETEVIEYIKKLHKRFVIISTDKASNNFTIVCK